MNRAIFSVCALIAGALSTSAQAAQDPRGLGDSGLQVRSAGMGAQASLRLKLGGREGARASERLELGIAAGPMIRTRIGNNGVTSKVASLASFRIRPGYSATLAFGGQPVVKHYTKQGAAEAKADGGGKGPSTLGWVGIGAGVVVGVLGIAYLALEDAIDCTENGEYVCE